jgi:glycosyltransferase involved in cell wall biosynthesis
MNKCPAISVVISVYNGAHFLEEALISIENQTFTDFEIIVIDDGSTDETASILSRRAKLDSRYRILSQPNMGQVPSLNRGVQSARASLIARMDADDIAEPERLAQQVRHLNENPSVALLGTAIRLINADGNILKLITYPSNSESISTALQIGNAFAHPSVIIKKEAILRVGCYREAFKPAEDYDLWLRINEIYEVANLTTALLRYRLHGDNLSVRQERLQRLAAYLARACAISRKSKKPEPIKNLESSIKSSELLAALDEYQNLKALFYLDSLKSHYKKAATVRNRTEDYLQAEEDIEGAWKLRRAIGRSRLIRVCIMPFIFQSWETDNKAKVFRWAIRSLKVDPATAFYSFLVNLIRRLRPAH